MTGLLSSFSVLSPFLSSFQSTPRCQGTFAVLAKNISDTAVAFEASIAMLNTDPGLREHGIRFFLLLGEFVFGLTFLFAFPFEWDDNLCLAYGESLETTVCTHLKFRCAGEVRFI